MQNYNYMPYMAQQQTPFINQQSNCINGKIVESSEIARGSEVPLGSYGVFPKADLSEVYIKTWGMDGQTQFNEYHKVDAINQNDILQDVYSVLKDIKKLLSSTSIKEVNDNELF